jgi:hypothetical protein
MPPRIGADPHVFVGRWNRKRADAFQIPRRRRTATRRNVAEPAAATQAANTRFGIARVPQPRLMRGLDRLLSIHTGIYTTHVEHAKAHVEP